MVQNIALFADGNNESTLARIYYASLLDIFGVKSLWNGRLDHSFLVCIAERQDLEGDTHRLGIDHYMFLSGFSCFPESRSHI
ncbi:MAG: hypothetical protein WBC05_04315 [Sedimentisphaerales bacterium]